MKYTHRNNKRVLFPVVILSLGLQSLHATEFVGIGKFMTEKSPVDQIHITDKMFTHYRKMMRQIPSSTLQNWVMIQEAFANLNELKQQGKLGESDLWHLKYVQAFGYSVVNLNDLAVLHQRELLKTSDKKAKVHALEDLSDAQETMGEYKDAVATTKILMEDLASTEPRHKNNYALRLLKAGEYDAAIKVLDQFEKTAEFSHVPLFKARGYSFKKDFKKAGENLRASCELGYSVSCTMNAELEKAKSEKDFWDAECASAAQRWAEPKKVKPVEFPIKEIVSSKFNVSEWFREIYPVSAASDAKVPRGAFIVVNDVPFFAVVLSKKEADEKLKVLLRSQHPPSAWGENIAVRNDFVTAELPNDRVLAVSIHATWQKEWIQKGLSQYRWR